MALLIKGDRARARSLYGYLWIWNWPITAREFSQPYNKVQYSHPGGRPKHVITAKLVFRLRSYTSHSFLTPKVASFPFVRSGRSNQSVLKWNARVLRTGSVQNAREFGELWRGKKMYARALDLYIWTGQNKFFCAGQTKQMAEMPTLPHFAGHLRIFAWSPALPHFTEISRIVVL